MPTRTKIIPEELGILHQVSQQNSDSLIPQFRSIDPTFIRGLDYQPDFRGIDQNNSFISKSMNELEQLGHQLDRKEALDATIEISTKTQAFADSYLEANPSGRGFSSSVIGYHKNLSDEIIGRASSGNSADMIEEMTARERGSLTINSLQKEKEVSLNYIVSGINENGAALLSKVFYNPEDAVALRQQYEENLAPLKDASPSTYAKMEKGYLEDFEKSQVMGIIHKDPWSAGKVLEKCQHISVQNRSHMLEAIEYRKRHIIQDRLRASESVCSVNSEKMNNRIIDVEDLIENNETSEFLIKQEGFPPEVESRLLKKQHRQEVKLNRERKQISEVITNAMNGVPNELVSDKIIHMAYQELIDNRKQTGADLTALDKYNMAKSLGANTDIVSLEQDLTEDILNGPPQQALQASVAVQYALQTNMKPLSNLDDRVVIASSLIATRSIKEGKTANNLGAIVKEIQTNVKENDDPQRILARRKLYDEQIKNTGMPSEIADLVKNMQNDSDMAKTYMENVRKSAFLSGMSGQELNRYMETVATSTMGESQLNYNKNNWIFNSGVMFMPPEKRFPNKSIEELKNSFYDAVDSLAASDQTGMLSSDSLMDTEKIKKEKDQKTASLTKPLYKNKVKYPTISLKINNRTEKRQVFLQSIPGDTGYNMYWLYDEKNPMTKQFLKLPGTSLPAVLRF